MRRVRTTKTLAQRIDLQYFTRPHSFRSWRLWLSVLVPVVAIAWFVAQRGTGQKVYSSGPLSLSHAVFTRQCEVCHVPRHGAFRAGVSDSACLQCHDAPAHHLDKAVFTPTCGSCHLEHKGSLRLASTRDESCTQCHTNLQTKSGALQYAATVKDFKKGHPEFAPLRVGATDPGRIKLSHYTHLRPNLAGPNGPVQLDCGDCHRLVGMEGTWPYAIVPGKTPSVQVDEAPGMADVRRSRRDAYMAPIVYAKQCAGCHIKDLQFDKRFDELAPHDKPEVVQAFLLQKYSDYFASHPGAGLEPVARERLVRGKLSLSLPVSQASNEWIKMNVMLADRLLFNKGCRLCHTMIEGDGGLPKVAKSSIPLRWLPHADFGHNSHRMLSCVACHSRAPDSHETADILLPGIASCRTCHQGLGPQQDAADGRCSECHTYHDWNKEQPTKGRFNIRQLKAAAGRVF